MSDPFAPIGGSGGGKGERDKPEWRAVVPVPATAPAAPSEHPRLGRPAAGWTYADARGELLGFVFRFDAPTGKQFRPLVFFEPIAGGPPCWRWESWTAPRPLYGLDELARRPGAPVVITEGEKACDAARELLPDHAVVTSPNGSKSAGKADWTALKGRRVVVWPDADDAGQNYARAIVKLATAAGVAAIGVVDVPDGKIEGWDAADARDEGMTEKEAEAFVRRLVDQSGDGNSEAPHNSPGGGRRRTPQRDSLMALTADCLLWHDMNMEGFATFPINGHRETWPVRSSAFRRWLAIRAYEGTGAVPGSQAVEDTIRVLEAQAATHGILQEPWLRVGSDGEATYLDLCDADWRAVRITPAGWSILEDHDLPFVRTQAMRPLPAPERGVIDALRPFVNVAADDDFTLTVSWLAAALWPTGPYPVLSIGGEQGSGKSTFSRLLRTLVDPNAAPIRAAPRDERDFVVAASNAHLLALDNLSKIEPWFSDGLCRLSTGGGFATRMLHTDREESVFQSTRPILINGISQLTDRADLADRSITIRLSTIAESDRRPEDEFWASWNSARPRVLGALCSALSAALRNLPSTRLDRLPRLADFAKLIVAAEGGFGWEAGTFMDAYDHNRRDVAETTFEADPVAVQIVAMVSGLQYGWEGTCTELLSALNEIAPENVKRARSWPMTAQALGNRLDRVAPLLRTRAIHLERRHSGVRTVKIAHLERA